MYLNQQPVQLPPEYPESLLSSIREEFLRSECTLVVLDDDPTGNQTSHDVTVLTAWRVGLIAAELAQKPSILFILTNSRSLPEQKALEVNREVCENLKAAARQTGRALVVISRSDSTLRGHFPAEVTAIAYALDMPQAVTVLVPAFIEGGRVTLNDVHYLLEKEHLTPVSETPFARDVVFGYRHADLKDWVVEKAHGAISRQAVCSVSLEAIRVGGPAAVSQILQASAAGSVCVVNAVSHRDLEVVALGLIWAERTGKQFLYRSSATLVPIRAGLASGKPFVPPETDNATASRGALIVVGSHVPKTTAQLDWLLRHTPYQQLLVSVPDLLQNPDRRVENGRMSGQIDEWLAAGTSVVLYTSREQLVGADEDKSLAISAQVSETLVQLVQGLTVRPQFVVAKGGITASDVASRGLAVEKARVLGSVLPGVPVWQLNETSKFPDLYFVVFPGNVGDEKALAEVCARLSR